MQEKRKPIWQSLYLEMIIKKNIINRLISQKIIKKGETVLTDTVRFVEKDFTQFLKVFVEISFSHKITNQCKMYI